MRTAWIVAVALGVAAALALSAAAYEVLSLGASLTRVVRELRAGPPPSPRSEPPRAPGVVGPRPAPGAATDTREVSVSFALGQDELSRLLRRQDVWLGGALGLTREVSCRLHDGHVAIETSNTVRVLGLSVASYPGFSDWGLTLLPRGPGVRLYALRLAGLPAPGASWLVRRFGSREDGWIVVPTGSRHRVERVIVGDGKLSVSGTVRERG